MKQITQKKLDEILEHSADKVIDKVGGDTQTQKPDILAQLLKNKQGGG